MAAEADLVIVAPLSANTLAKLALGLADNLLTATLLATPIRGLEGKAAVARGDAAADADRGVPWVLAPAMESHMWANPMTQAHMAALTGRARSGGPGEVSGIRRARRGRMADRGDPGRRDGRWQVAVRWQPGVSQTAGTQEPPIRRVTSPTHRPGRWASPAEATGSRCGCDTGSAPLAVSVPFGIERTRSTAIEMRDAVWPERNGYLIAAAAVAISAQTADQKIG
jgi:phosphopantothenoylcysteine decarboxylase/phosphopantothenate--cysteine ligase